MSEYIERVLDCLKRGDFNAAVAVSERWCDAEPGNPVAWNLRGVAGMNGNAYAEARICFERALELQSDYAKARCNLGLALRRQGLDTQALEAFTAAAESDPELFEAESNRVLLLLELGRVRDALECAQRCLGRFPTHPDAELLRVRCWIELGEIDAARGALEALTRAQPDNVDAWRALARMENGAGNVRIAEEAYRYACLLAPDDSTLLRDYGVLLLRQGRAADALPWLERSYALNADSVDVAIDLSGALIARRRHIEARDVAEQGLRRWPDNGWLLYNLGCVESASFRYESAKQALKAAVTATPGLSDAHHALGHVHEKLGEIEEAIACYRDALRANPHNADTHCNLGGIEWSRLRMTEAEAHYREAIRLAPDLANAHFNLGIVLLACARFEEGWREYAWRDRTDPPAGLSGRFPQPVWRGENLRGRGLLIHAEQGMGDTLQFVRYAPLLRAQGARVVVESQAALKRLLARMPGIDEVVVPGSMLPDFDFQIPMLGVPGVVGTSLDSIPRSIPYLTAYPDEAEQWRLRLDTAAPGFRVGIVWAGNPRNPNDRNRSMSVAQLRPLAAIPRVRWFSLQKEVPADRARLEETLPGAIDWTPEFDDFATTAALVANLDLVIAVDTSIVHLAGALGRPVWAMLPFAPDWRWLLDRDDSLWYDEVRLFRQPRIGDWDAVIADIAQALSARVALSAST